MFKYLLVIIIVIILYVVYLAHKKESSINYFEPNNKHLIDDVLKRYTSFIKPYESKKKLDTNILLDQDDLTNEYYNKIIHFNYSDRSIISSVIGKIITKCFKFRLFYKNFEWNIVKTKDSLEWGMPFTLSNYIFLPESHININREEQLLNTLIHEQIHIFQRKIPMLFATLYIDLGYTYIDYLRLPKHLEELRITNPDGIYINWVFTLNDTLFLPLILMDSNDNNNIIKRGVFLQKNEKYYEPILFNDTVQLIEFKNYKEFYNKFNGCHGLYHPNELIAHSFTDWFLDKKTINGEIQKFFETKFIEDYNPPREEFIDI